MKSAILVAGTHSWSPEGADWFSSGSRFEQLLNANGIVSLKADGRPFIWSTALGGVGFGDRDVYGWMAAGLNLFAWAVPPLCPDRCIPPEATNIISHSHGLQVALSAAAMGLKIHTLISVTGPVRKDMQKIAEQARPNIKTWVHIHSDESDWWQRFGQMFDGQLGMGREHPMADLNFYAPGGHSKVLREPETYNWPEWLTYLGPHGRRTPSDLAVA